MGSSGLTEGQRIGALLLQVADIVGADKDALAAFSGGERSAAVSGRGNGWFSKSAAGGCEEGAAVSLSGARNTRESCGGGSDPRRPIRVMLVCGPPRSGKSTYIVETFGGEAGRELFEFVAYCNFLASGAYPRAMPLRRREMIALAMFQEFAEDAIRRCQKFASSPSSAPSARGCAGEPLVVVEGPFCNRCLRLAVVAGLRAALRECDVLECRWVGYPRIVGDAVRRAGYDTFKQCSGCSQVPRAEEGFDELHVLAVPPRIIPEGLRLRVDALNGRDTVTEHNLLCRPDLLLDSHFRSDSIWA